MKYDLIYITGPDGVGKTTQANLIVNKLKDKGLKAEYKWLRFHHLFSLPLLILARFLKLSEIIEENETKIGYHYFYKSRFISLIYVYLLSIDTVIFTAFKVYIPLYVFKKTIVCDRFVYDTIIDMIISTHNYNMFSSSLCRILSKLIPKKSYVLLLISDLETIKKRRKDLQFDKLLIDKICLYEKLGKKFNLKNIEASLSIQEINNIILSDLNE